VAALLERCHLYVGNDNGPRHFAIAVGTPTVAVFGKPFPENWTPPGDPRHRALTMERLLLWEGSSVDADGRFSPAILDCQVQDLWPPSRRCGRVHGGRACHA